MLLTIIAFIIVLGVLVFVHELGHFLAARRFGVTAEEFGLGFPPRLFGWYRSAAGNWKMVWGKKEVTDAVDTIYSFNLVPIGGFVKIKGENGTDPADTSSMASKPIWQRVVILSAGVLMNIALAAVLFIGLLSYGAPQAIDGAEMPQGAVVGERSIQVVAVAPETPAAVADVKPGDVIKSINGVRFEDYGSLQAFVAERAGQKLAYEFSRGNDVFVKEITPVVREETGRGGIGIEILETATVRLPWYRAIVEGIKLTGLMLWAIIAGIAGLLYSLVSSGQAGAEVVGPIGIASLTGDMLRLGIVYLVQFAAILSLHLAVINFVPFPALDGGRVLFALIEKIKGRPVRQKTEAIFHNVGFLILIGLILLVTLKDVIKLF